MSIILFFLSGFFIFVAGCIAITLTVWNLKNEYQKNKKSVDRAAPQP